MTIQFLINYDVLYHFLVCKLALPMDINLSPINKDKNTIFTKLFLKFSKTIFYTYIMGQ